MAGLPTLAVPQGGVVLGIVTKTVRPEARGGGADRTNRELVLCLKVKPGFCPRPTAALPSRHTEPVPTWDPDRGLWSVLSPPPPPLLLQAAGER